MLPISESLQASALASQVALLRQGDGAAKDPARRAAEDFEAFFLARVMDSMFAGIKTDGPLGGGHSEQVFRGMLNEEYAKVISRSGGIGVADAVYREILKLQEASAP